MAGGDHAANFIKCKWRSPSSSSLYSTCIATGSIFYLKFLGVNYIPCQLWIDFYQFPYNNRMFYRKCSMWLLVNLPTYLTWQRITNKKHVLTWIHIRYILFICGFVGLLLSWSVRWFSVVVWSVEIKLMIIKPIDIRVYLNFYEWTQTSGRNSNCLTCDNDRMMMTWRSIFRMEPPPPPPSPSLPPSHIKWLSLGHKVSIGCCHYWSYFQFIWRFSHGWRRWRWPASSSSALLTH